MTAFPGASSLLLEPTALGKRFACKLQCCMWVFSMCNDVRTMMMRLGVNGRKVLTVCFVLCNIVLGDVTTQQQGHQAARLIGQVNLELANYL